MKSILAALALASLVVPVHLVGPAATGQDPPPKVGPAAKQHTVILVRHAEKALDGDPKDPGLAPAGEVRAERLAALLAKSGATRLVASEYHRTQATLAPLARSLNLTIETRPAREIDALVRELARAAPGSVTVVAGHSNTVPKLAAKLGVPLADLSGPPGEMAEGEYDRVVVISLPPKDAPVQPSCIELRYGAD